MSRIVLLAACCVVLLFPSFAGAADRVLFSRLGPTKAALLISRADGSGERALLPATSLDYDPAWSPRGGRIAFTSERGGSADLYRIHPDGTGLGQLTDNQWEEGGPAWLPQTPGALSGKSTLTSPQ